MSLHTDMRKRPRGTPSAGSSLENGSERVRFPARARRAAACGVFLAIGTGAAATAQTQPPALMRELTACRAIAGDAERLACFDKAVGAIDRAAAKGDVVMIDREQAEAAKRQAFGLALPKLPALLGGDDEASVDAVTGVVDTARQDANGAWIIRLQDGQVWSQVDTSAIFRDPKPGMAVRIRKASLGSFLMSIDGKGAIRARRLR